MNCVDAATAARLISAGASASTTDSDGNDALDLAHMRGAQEATAFLSAGGKTPSASARLVRAVWTQDADELRQALATGASTQTKDQHGSPVLYLSADLQSTDLMSILLDHGADIEARDKHGNTPLRIALSRAGTLDVVEGCIALLLDRHARLDDVNQFHEAAIFFGQQWWWLPEISRRILLPCAQARSKEGNTALMISAERGTPEHVQMLLHLPNPPEISACNSAGLTALHIAANGSAEYGAEQYVEKAELLIKAGAALEAADTNGETPIFKAVASEHRRMVELFIRCGADCRRRNLAGESLATVALRSGSGSLFNWVRSLCG